MNQLLIDLNNSIVSSSYHDNDNKDCLAEYVKENLNWEIKKNGL